MLTNDISVAEEIGLELGGRVFSAMCAENSGMRFIQGVSVAFYLTDTSDDWSDIIAMTYDDSLHDFTLLQGVRMLIPQGMNQDAALRWLEAWEKQEPIDWWYEEWIRAATWEDWVAEGGMDDE